MINQIDAQPMQKPKKSKARYLNIKYSGYTALTLGAACGITGLKSVKMPHKHQLHKYFGWITILSSFWHLAAIKKWDQMFKKSDNTTINNNISK